MSTSLMKFRHPHVYYKKALSYSFEYQNNEHNRVLMATALYEVFLRTNLHKYLIRLSSPIIHNITFF